MPCYSPLKGWKDPDSGGIRFRREGAHTAMAVACGQCLGCRLDRSRMWAMRIIHESMVHDMDEGNTFVTLTYRSKWECDSNQLKNGWHVPDDWSLHKSHFQKFMKRLRRRSYEIVDGKKKYQRIRFFHAGEYGAVCRHEREVEECEYCNVGRPHYHAVLFNWSPDDWEPVGQRHDITYYTSPRLEAIWKYGFVQVAEVSFESAAYVARYCLKKRTGEGAQGHYENMDDDGVIHKVLPEYCTMSRSPGLGAEFYEQYKDDIWPADEVPVPGSGVFKKVPRYYQEILEAEDPLTLEEMKAVRKKFMQEHGDEYTPERLMDKYKVKKAQVDLLKRTLK
jgi:hypothetical protein